MKLLLKFFIFFTFIIIIDAACYAQQQPIILTDTAGKKYVTMPAGPKFGASGWKQLWWGKRWRKEWLQPVKFPLFDMDTTVGGLTPLKKGGGFQTKSLRLISKSGKEYVLRTIDKDLDKIVPAEFKGTLVHDILEDQLSFSHPYSALPIARLADAIGSMHTNPVIVFVPDEPLLGEYKNDFTNKLCLFEERPSGDGWEKSALTNDADEIINSEKLFQKLDANNNRSVDQLAFLKIRLFDMLINDWDRHADQWVWAGFKKNGKTIYQPFARDRDQGFSKPDGIIVSYFTLPWMIRKIRNLKPHVNDVRGLNEAALMLDKRLLNELNKEDWLAVASEIQSLLPDSVIKNALLQMPENIYSISGNSLHKILISRRNDLIKIAAKYYDILSKQVVINGSEKQEQFLINKIDRNTTAVTVLKKQTAAKIDTVYYRIFNKKVTKELNVYGMGGEDQFVFLGRKKNNISIRLIGDTSNDSFLDRTIITGNGKASRIYDSGNAPINLPAGYVKNFSADTSYMNFKPKEFRNNWWKIILAPTYNPDDGLVIKSGFAYRKYAWHKKPFSWEQTITAALATNTGAVGINYKALFPKAIGKADVELEAELKGPKYVLNYYGLGNNSSLKDNTISYFRVRSSGITIKPSLTHKFNATQLNTGLLFQSVKIQPTPGKFIAEPANGTDSSVFKTKYFTGLNIALSGSYFKNKLNQNAVFYYHTEGAYTLNLQQRTNDFLKLEGSLKLLWPLSKSLSIAHRTGAATNIGKFEFYQAATIGGMDKLRGYWRSRFAGQSSFYQNTELRWDIGKLNGYILRGGFGCFSFFDNGRVWVKNERSTGLHTGYGVGIYFVPFNLLPLNFIFASSKEANVFTFKTGFFF